MNKFIVKTIKTSFFLAIFSCGNGGNPSSGGGNDVPKFDNASWFKNASDFIDKKDYQKAKKEIEKIDTKKNKASDIYINNLKNKLDTSFSEVLNEINTNIKSKILDLKNFKSLLEIYSHLKVEFSDSLKNTLPLKISELRKNYEKLNISNSTTLDNAKTFIEEIENINKNIEKIKKEDKKKTLTANIDDINLLVSIENTIKEVMKKGAMPTKNHLDILVSLVYDNIGKENSESLAKNLKEKITKKLEELFKKENGTNNKYSDDFINFVNEVMKNSKLGEGAKAFLQNNIINVINSEFKEIKIETESEMKNFYVKLNSWKDKFTQLGSIDFDELKNTIMSVINKKDKISTSAKNKVNSLSAKKISDKKEILDDIKYILASTVITGDNFEIQYKINAIIDSNLKDTSSADDIKSLIEIALVGGTLDYLKTKVGEKHKNLFDSNESKGSGDDFESFKNFSNAILSTNNEYLEAIVRDFLDNTLKLYLENEFKEDDKKKNINDFKTKVDNLKAKLDNLKAIKGFEPVVTKIISTEEEIKRKREELIAACDNFKLENASEEDINAYISNAKNIPKYKGTYDLKAKIKNTINEKFAGDIVPNFEILKKLSLLVEQANFTECKDLLKNKAQEKGVNLFTNESKKEKIKAFVEFTGSLLKIEKLKNIAIDYVNSNVKRWLEQFAVENKDKNIDAKVNLNYILDLNKLRSDNQIIITALESLKGQGAGNFDVQYGLAIDDLDLKIKGIFDGIVGLLSDNTKYKEVADFYIAIQNKTEVATQKDDMKKVIVKFINDAANDLINSIDNFNIKKSSPNFKLKVEIINNLKDNFKNCDFYGSENLEVLLQQSLKKYEEFNKHLQASQEFADVITGITNYLKLKEDEDANEKVVSELFNNFIIYSNKNEKPENYQTSIDSLKVDLEEFIKIIVDFDILVKSEADIKKLVINVKNWENIKTLADTCSVEIDKNFEINKKIHYVLLQNPESASKLLNFEREMLKSDSKEAYNQGHIEKNLLVVLHTEFNENPKSLKEVVAFNKNLEKWKTSLDEIKNDKNITISETLKQKLDEITKENKVKELFKKVIDEFSAEDNLKKMFDKNRSGEVLEFYKQVKGESEVDGLNVSGIIDNENLETFKNELIITITKHINVLFDILEDPNGKSEDLEKFNFESIKNLFDNFKPYNDDLKFIDKINTKIGVYINQAKNDISSIIGDENYGINEAGSTILSSAKVYILNDIFPDRKIKEDLLLHYENILGINKDQVDSLDIIIKIRNFSILAAAHLGNIEDIGKGDNKRESYDLELKGFDTLNLKSNELTKNMNLLKQDVSKFLIPLSPLPEDMKTLKERINDYKDIKGNNLILDENFTALCEEYITEYKDKLEKYIYGKDIFNKYISLEAIGDMKNLVDSKLAEIAKEIQDINVEIQDFNDIKELNRKVPKLLAKIHAWWTIDVSARNYLDAKKLFAGKDKFEDSINKTVVNKMHNVQIISSLMMLLTKSNTNDKIANHIMQIPTGNGKSVVNAALASIFAKSGYRVLVPTFSEILASRDQASFSKLFASLGLAENIKYGTLPMLIEEVINEKGDIRKKIKDYFTNSNSEVENLKESKKVIAIVDEIDVLLDDVLKNMYTPRVVIDDENIKKILDLIWNEINKSRDAKSNEFYKNNFSVQDILLNNVKTKNGSDGLNLYNSLITNILKGNVVEQEVSLFKKRIDAEISKMILAAYNVKFESKQKDTFTLVDDGSTIKIGYKEFDSYNTKITQGYKTIFEYKKIISELEIEKTSSDNNSQKNKIEIATKINKLKSSLDEIYGMYIHVGEYDYLEVLKSFDIIMGVTGTLDTISEENLEYVKNLGFEKFTISPNIYDKSKNVKINIEENYDAQLEKIISIIKESNKENTPLIIYYDTDENGLKLKKAIFHALDNKTLNFQVTYCQDLNESLSQDTKEQIIKNATAFGKVTIASRSFGRGIDYKVYDPRVKKKGVKIMQVFLSEEISEEVQIKGRTNRQGEEGEYVLVLNKQDLNSKFKITNNELNDTNNLEESLKLNNLFKKQREKYLQEKYSTDKNIRALNRGKHLLSKYKLENINSISKSDDFFFPNQLVKLFVGFDYNPSYLGTTSPIVNKIIKDHNNNINQKGPIFETTFLNYYSACFYKETVGNVVSLISDSNIVNISKRDDKIFEASTSTKEGTNSGILFALYFYCLQNALKGTKDALLTGLFGCNDGLKNSKFIGEVLSDKGNFNDIESKIIRNVLDSKTNPVNENLEYAITENDLLLYNEACEKNSIFRDLFKKDNKGIIKINIDMIIQYIKATGMKVNILYVRSNTATENISEDYDKEKIPFTIFRQLTTMTNGEFKNLWFGDNNLIAKYTQIIEDMFSDVFKRNITSAG